jgi:hypothetical protein
VIAHILLTQKKQTLSPHASPFLFDPCAIGVSCMHDIVYIHCFSKYSTKGLYPREPTRLNPDGARTTLDFLATPRIQSSGDSPQTQCLMIISSTRNNIKLDVSLALAPCATLRGYKRSTKRKTYPLSSDSELDRGVPISRFEGEPVTCVSKVRNSVEQDVDERGGAAPNDAQQMTHTVGYIKAATE